jgi:hypothetical protein
MFLFTITSRSGRPNLCLGPPTCQVDEVTSALELLLPAPNARVNSAWSHTFIPIIPHRDVAFN